MNDALKAALLEQAKREQARRVKPQADMSLMGRVKDNLLGVDDGVMSTGEKIATALNMGGESLTLGVVGDEAAAAADALIGRGPYDERLAKYRGDEKRVWEESPALAAGAVVGPAFIPGIGQASWVTKAPTLVGKVARGAMAGGAAGAVGGFMEGEGGFERRRDASTVGAVAGGALGAAIPAVGAGARSAIQTRATAKAIKEAAKKAPTTEELHKVGSALYDEVDRAGVEIKPEAFDRFRDSLIRSLRSRTGFDELPGSGSLTPNTARVVGIMDEASSRMAQEPTAALPFRSLDQMRRQAGAAAGNISNRADKQAGSVTIELLDDFVRKLTPDDVVGGDVNALKSAIFKARRVWSQMSKSQVLDDAMEKSDNYLSGAASGVRNQFKNILQSKKLSAMFSPAEKKALRLVTHGTVVDQIVNLAGGGLSQMAMIGSGAATGGIAGGLAGTAAAASARKLSEAVTMRNAEIARRAIASGKLKDPQVLNALTQIGGRTENALNALGFSGNNALATRP